MQTGTRDENAKNNENVKVPSLNVGGHAASHAPDGDLISKGHQNDSARDKKNNDQDPTSSPRAAKGILKRGSVSSPQGSPRGGSRKASLVANNGSPRRSSLGRKLDSARDFDKKVAAAAGTGEESASEQQPADEGMPRLRTQRLARGGVYVHTCIGPIQVGIPPETIKDCLGAGMAVPRHYIVPAERFNRQLGNNMGINVAEFEFPAYMNKFFYNQSVNLIVDSKEVEDRIRTVFQETLFGPETIDPDVDYARDYPAGDKPDLPKELKYFRRYGDSLLTIDMFLSFTHFNHGKCVENVFRTRMRSG